jgi:trehalose 6-phosphate synthase complex regulatory subunit
MTLFIASLFLPYTINFDSNDSTPENVTRQPTKNDEDPRKNNAVSLWTPGPSTHGALSSTGIPKTPGATTNLETIFQPYIERPFNLSAPSPRRKGKQTPANNSTTSLPNASTIRHPHLMPLSDLYSPSEIKSPYWNQPPSRAGPPPPSDIRHFKAQVQEKAASLAWRATRTSRERSRNSSSERKFTEDNYAVRAARRGNGGLWQVIDSVSDAGLLNDKTWVGTLGMNTDALDDHLKSVIFERLEDDYESLV